jgi:hypothetical protein
MIDEFDREAKFLDVPPPGYSEEDAMEVDHPGHPSNYGDH